MKSGDDPKSARGALDIIEEAVHLLRRSPASRLAAYYIGTLPFILGFLYFWADMSRSVVARWYLGEAAFGLTVLFLWMKFWHGVFAQGLKEALQGNEKTPWTVKRVLRILKFQTVVQPAGLFLLPLALLVTMPFGWAYAFYQNVLTVGHENDDLKTVCRKALQQAALWPGQNHILLGAMSLFGIFVFGNLAVALVFIPQLLNMLLGVDTVFTHAGIHILNTTFFITVCALTYLCIDPLMKAAYVLRCFYGESLSSGEDLRVGLRSIVTAGAALLLFIAVGTIPFGDARGVPAAMAFAGEAVPAAGAGAIVPADLDNSISEVLNRREYRWRMPRAVDENGAGTVRSFIERFMGWLGSLFEPVWDALKKFFNWLKGLLPDRIGLDLNGDRTDFGWMTLARGLTLFLLVTVGLALGIFLWRFWKRRRRPETVHDDVVVAVPNPADEEVEANELPSAEWAAIARRLMDRGELRLALRALYLAGLAYLAEKDMIAIAKFKSDRDYERDLRRRVHAKPDLLTAFSQNLLIFEGAWYGMRRLSRQDLQSFSANLERMKLSV